MVVTHAILGAMVPQMGKTQILPSTHKNKKANNEFLQSLGRQLHKNKNTDPKPGYVNAKTCGHGQVT